MTGADVLEQAREAFRDQSWEQAYTRFGAADQDSRLAPSDLELFARAAYLTGKDDDCVSLLERSYHLRIGLDEEQQAAETAFWLAFNLMNRGQVAQAGGWLARAEQLLASAAPDYAVRGLLLVPMALQNLMQGDAATALPLFTQAHEIGQRNRDPEVTALGGLGIGQARIAMGETTAGLAQLDEVMVAITAGEVSPIVSGLVYCAVIIACHETYHLQRAAEWTRALSRWCDAQPDLVPFRGQCLVHRAQILQLNGAWEDAMDQIHLAHQRLSEPPGQPAVGMAYYELGELHRLRGGYAAADDAYRQASRCGHQTQPGLALLRLAQGNVEAAQAGVRRALDESHGGDRPRLLAAYVEIALAADQVAEARSAADELAVIASGADTAVLTAMSEQASGAVLLAEGHALSALDSLRPAWRRWRDLDAPYLGARVRVLQAQCCRELGDHDAAQMELDAAGEIFRQLRASSDLAVIERLGALRADTGAGGLTAREVQVLRAVATGKTNRAVAEDLFLSEKTVARHVSNIFTKLDLSSRSAATAYAYEHDLL